MTMVRPCSTCARVSGRGSSAPPRMRPSPRSCDRSSHERSQLGSISSEPVSIAIVDRAAEDDWVRDRVRVDASTGHRRARRPTRRVLALVRDFGLGGLPADAFPPGRAAGDVVVKVAAVATRRSCCAAGRNAASRSYTRCAKPEGRPRRPAMTSIQGQASAEYAGLLALAAILGATLALIAGPPLVHAIRGALSGALSGTTRGSAPVVARAADVADLQSALLATDAAVTPDAALVALRSRHGDVRAREIADALVLDAARAAAPWLGRPRTYRAWLRLPDGPYEAPETDAATAMWRPRPLRPRSGGSRSPRNAARSPRISLTTRAPATSSSTASDSCPAAPCSGPGGLAANWLALLCAYRTHWTGRRGGGGHRAPALGCGRHPARGAGWGRRHRVARAPDVLARWARGSLAPRRPRRGARPAAARARLPPRRLPPTRRPRPEVIGEGFRA